MNIFNILTITISAISLVLSIGHIAYEIWERRTKIKITIDENAGETGGYLSRYPDKNKLFLPCIFLNQSHSDISIVSVTAILDNNCKCRAYMQERFVCHNFWKSPDTGTVFEKITNTVRFPVNLVSLQGDCGILGFELPVQDKYIFKDVIVETNKRTVHLKEFAPLITDFVNKKSSRYYERSNSHNE